MYWQLRRDYSLRDGAQNLKNMILKLLKKCSRSMLCVAIVFIVTNASHAIAHDHSAEITEGHVECVHCTDEQFTLVGSPKLTARPQRAALLDTILWLGPSPVASYSCQARAPPVS